MIHHRLDAGRWECLARDVFRMAGALPSWRQSLMAACLAWGEGAVVSHRAAAALWNLPGFDAAVAELTVPIHRRRAAPGVVHRHRLLPFDVTSVQGIPVTSVDRTLLDVAGDASFREIEEPFDDALRRKIVRLSRMRWRLDNEARSGRPGIIVLRTLLEARSKGAVPQSVFETRLLRTLLRANLPEPSRQHEVRCGDRIMFVDFAYPMQRIAIEAEGYRWHSGRPQWERDLARRNDLTRLGWRVIHVTWAALNVRPQAVVGAVRDALGSSP